MKSAIGFCKNDNLLGAEWFPAGLEVQKNIFFIYFQCIVRRDRTMHFSIMSSFPFHFKIAFHVNAEEKTSVENLHISTAHLQVSLMLSIG